VRTRHHKLPRRFFGNPQAFYDMASYMNALSNNIRVCSELEHNAWNTLTNSSQKSLAETAESLSRFIPDDCKFIVVKRN